MFGAFVTTVDSLLAVKTQDAATTNADHSVLTSAPVILGIQRAIAEKNNYFLPQYGGTLEVAS